MADSGKKKNGAAAGQKGGAKKKAAASSGSGGARSSSSGNSSAARKKASGGSSVASGAGSRLRDEITGVLLAALGVFLIVAVMTEAAGKFGTVLSHFLKGLFGFGAYILPFYILLCAVLLLANRMAHISGKSVFLLLLIYLSVVAANSVGFDAVAAPQFGADYLKAMYLQGITLDSAGAVGMGIGWLAVKGVGKVGLLIICIAIILISAMLLVNSPLSGLLDRRREKKYRAAMAKAAEREAEEAAARERQEMMQQLKAAELEESYNSGERKRGRGRRRKEAGSQEAGGEDGAALRSGSYAPSGEGSGSSADFEDLRIKSTGLFQNDAFSEGTAPSEATMTQNRLHILEYMKDDSLFSANPKSLWQEDSDGSAFVFSEGNGGTGGREEDRFGAYNAYDAYDAAGDGGRLQEEFFPCGGESGGGDGGAAGVGAFDGSRNAELPEGRKDPASLREETEADSTGPHESHGSHGSPTSHPQDGVVTKMSKSEAAAVISAGAAEVASQANQAPEKKHYSLPPLSLLNKAKRTESRNQRAELAARAQKLETVLHNFGVSARVIDVKKGPAVTRYEIQPDTGVKVNSIVRLSDDIALNLEAKSLRIEAPIPGKAAVGIEVENEKTSVVTLREMIESDAFQKAESKISFVVGEDISGNSVVADLKSMPHLLIAGSTGSGKSVCINSIIMSMLYKSTPDEVRLILIDPKVVELGNYNGIPHMLIPVITDPSKAAAALAWAVQEMNERYKKFAEASVRDLKSFNTKMKKEERPDAVLPQIVIIIDELADLMMAAPSQVEEAICRLAQLARAAGMHLIVATQRPSVDIVTGLIKANIPSRIAFAVSSQFDSRTILDRAGAEKLVGKGDMLFNPIGMAQPERLQGPFVTDDEVNAVIEFWKAQAGEDNAPNQIMESINTVKVSVSDDEEEDELLDDAIELVVGAEQASASMLQRRFRIGYNRAGRLIDIMEARGIIGPSEGSKPRRVLLTKEEYYGVPEEDTDGAFDAPEEASGTFRTEAQERMGDGEIR